MLSLKGKPTYYFEPPEGKGVEEYGSFLLNEKTNRTSKRKAKKEDNREKEQLSINFSKVLYKCIALPFPFTCLFILNSYINCMKL